MPPRLQIQSSTPLNTQPLTVELPKKFYLAKASSNSTDRKTPKGPDAAKSNVPKQFLSAGVPERVGSQEYEAAILTVQGAGIYLYDLATSQPVQSWSVAPGTVFTSPARFVPSVSHSAQTTNFPETPAEDGTEGVNSTLRSGDVFVGVETALSGSKKQGDGQQLWRFDVASVENIAGAQPEKFNLPHAIQSLFPISTSVASPASHLVITHPAGHISIYPRTNLQPSQPTAFYAPDSQQTVLWSKGFQQTLDANTEVEGDNLSETHHIVNVLHSSSSNSYTLRIHTVSALSMTQTEYALPTPPMDENAPKRIRGVSSVIVGVSFVLCGDSRGGVLGKLVVAYPTRLKVYTVPAVGTFLLETLTIPLTNGLYQSSHVDASTLSQPGGVKVQCLSEEYVAILGSERNGNVDEDRLFIWDLKYGTLQYEGALRPGNAESEGLDAGVTVVANSLLWTDLYQTSTSGRAILVTRSSIISTSPLKFKSTVTSTPFYTPRLTLASALGQGIAPRSGSKQSKSQPKSLSINGNGLVGTVQTPLPHPLVQPRSDDSDPVRDFKSLLTAMNDLDAKHVQNLEVLPELTQTVKAFESFLRGWIVEKCKLSSGSGQTPQQQGFEKLTFEQLPHVEFSGLVLSRVWIKIMECVEKSTEAKAKDIIPRRFINYLLRTRQLSTRSVPGGVVGLVTRARDVELFQGVLARVGDLKEKELVAGVSWIVGDGRE
ncbi:hypothetical protein HK097_002360, partial [Rhizophlyctis rosea]